MFPIGFFCNEAFAPAFFPKVGAALAALVHGPLIFPAAAVYRPGAKAGEIYRPGAMAGEVSG